MTKISIIVPVYNSEKYLKKCLNSLINQTLKDIEIIIVNDGSTDKGKQIILEYAKKDSRIKNYDKQNGGQASARNLGLSKALGEYVMFIDSDDYVELDICEKLYNTITNGYDIVCTDYYITENGKDTYHKINNSFSKELSPKEYILNTVSPCNKIYKTKFLIDNNFSFPEGIIYEDYASIPTLGKYNPKTFYLKEALLHYVHHNNSTMRTNEYKKKYEDIFFASNYLYDNLVNQNFNDELEYLLIYHLLYLGSLNFYKYQKYDQIDKISNFMKEKFPKWGKNKYLKTFTFKEKVLMKLFYYKKYSIIKLCQKIKR